VARGSNDKNPALPGYKWYTYSTDGGYTWAPLCPWRYTDGTAFFSPSACSQLLWHRSGRLFWIGNITPLNPRGNRPRYPLVIGEVDTRSLLLRRESVTEIATRQPEDDEQMTLSNFYAHEDRETGEIVIYCTRAHVHGLFTGSAYRYRVTV